MNNILKTIAIVMLFMGTQFAVAQQSPASQRDRKNPENKHKRLDDKATALDEEQKAMEYKKTLSGRSSEDQKNTDERIAQIKAERQTLEGKKRKITELENNLNATNEKMRKLAADQEAEYKKNGPTSNDAILKQRAAAKDNLNNLYQQQAQQEAEIDKLDKP